MSGTPEGFTRCGTCGVLFGPEYSQSDCPHRSKNESTMLKNLREGGKPYLSHNSRIPELIAEADATGAYKTE